VAGPIFVNNPLTRSVPAESDAFAALADLVEHALAQSGCARRDVLRLTLVLEELFTNTVKYGGGSAHPVTVELSRNGPHSFTVRYEDGALRFDPFATKTSPETSVKQQRVGGLGLALVQRMVESPQHTWTGTGNRITFRFAATPQ
jgi:anti-sigma regulatory factor (Ser/Thr protein kinase)